MEDKIKPKVKPIITAEEFQQIKSDAEAASEILTDERFKFFREYLRNQKEIIVSDFVNNKIRKTTVIDKGEIKDVQTEYAKGEQEHELSGKFKFIFELIERFQWYVTLYEEAKKAQENKAVTVEGDPEKKK